VTKVKPLKIRACRIDLLPSSMQRPHILSIKPTWIHLKNLSPIASPSSYSAPFARHSNGTPDPYMVYIQPLRPIAQPPPYHRLTIQPSSSPTPPVLTQKSIRQSPRYLPAFQQLHRPSRLLRHRLFRPSQRAKCSSLDFLVAGIAI